MLRETDELNDRPIMLKSMTVAREDWILSGTSLALILAMLLALALVHSPSQVFPAGFVNARPYLLLLFLAYLAYLFPAFVRHKPAHPMHFLYAPGVGREAFFLTARHLPIVLAIALFMPAFSAVKSSIPLFNPYSWDQTFIDLDIAIHGTDPWQILQPLLGRPWITSLLSRIYHLWFLLIYLGPVLATFLVTDRRLRFRFFASFLLTWSIVGVVLAIAFSSVGPCFVGPIEGNGHFDEQMHYLQAANEQHPVAVLEIQRLLLDWHNSGQHGLGRGITAMPSMHVALAFLYVLLTIKISKPLAWLSFAFFILIMISSVHLAYHYAVDGYLSILVTWLIWISTKPLARIVVGDSLGKK